MPDEIESCDPDYSIYPNCDYSIQLFSRGCPRKCSFCVVPEKEGGIRPVKPMELNPNGKRIEILDNNFFANPEWEDVIKILKSYNRPVNITQGVDARTITDEQLQSLMTLKHHKQIYMAWDNPRQKIEWDRIIKVIPPRKIMVYVLTGHNTTEEEDLYRVEKLRSLKISPFVMLYNNKKDWRKRNFARWVNLKRFFHTVSFKDFLKIRGACSNA